MRRMTVILANHCSHVRTRVVDNVTLGHPRTEWRTVNMLSQAFEALGELHACTSSKDFARLGSESRRGRQDVNP